MKSLFLVISIYSLFLSCGIESAVEPEFINPPGSVSAYSLNNKIKIKFYASNKESNFDGFNVYVAKESSLRNKKLNPVKNPANGSVPTISMSAKNVDSSVPVEITISRDSNDEYIENGITYFIIVKSHSINNVLSEPSNEVSATPRISNLNGVTVAVNSGFNMSTHSTSQLWDFKFQKISNKFYIVPLNGAGVSTKGYYEDWTAVNSADDIEFVYNAPLFIEQGDVIVIKTADEHYGKIQIKNLSESGVEFIWAYQQIQYNKEI